MQERGSQLEDRPVKVLGAEIDFPILLAAGVPYLVDTAPAISPAPSVRRYSDGRAAQLALVKMLVEQVEHFLGFFTISDICSMIASSLKICFISVSDSLHTTGQKASSKSLKTYLFSPRTGKAPPKRGLLLGHNILYSSFLCLKSVLKTVQINIITYHYNNSKNYVVFYWRKKIQVHLSKTIDKCTWQRYNENMTRKLVNSIWRFPLWIRTKF